MKKKSIYEIEREYDLEIDRVVKIIKQNRAKLVLLQFPDGLKPYSTIIADEIEKQANCECTIWLDTCYGACDTPNVDKIKPKIDLIIQFGHSKWKYKKGIKVV